MGRGHAASAASGWVRHRVAVVVVWIVECVGPALFEGGDESCFDFVGDVGIDFLDFVGEFVAQAAGLADFGDAVGDHPGFVAVA